METFRKLALIFLSAQHCILLKSPHDYVEGLLSLAYIPNIVVVGMARIVAKHATSTRKDDAKYFGKGDKEGNIFNPFNGRVADPDIV